MYIFWAEQYASKHSSETHP